MFDNLKDTHDEFIIMNHSAPKIPCKIMHDYMLVKVAWNLKEHFSLDIDGQLILVHENVSEQMNQLAAFHMIQNIHMICKRFISLQLLMIRHECCLCTSQLRT